MTKKKTCIYSIGLPTLYYDISFGTNEKKMNSLQPKQCSNNTNERALIDNRAIFEH